MPDNLENLPDLPDLSDLRGVDVQPPPASEVRARGDRLRRRRTTLAVLGAAAAVVIVAGGTSLLGGGPVGDGAGPADSRHTPGATVAPDAAPAGSLADEFPLDVGLPAVNEDGTAVEVRVGTEDDLVLCGRTAWTGTRAMDLATTSYSQPEDYRGRTLLLYPSVEEATDAVEQARSTLAGCPVEEGADSQVVYTPVADDTVGDEAVMFAQRSRAGGQFGLGVTLYRLVRVGPAVLLTVDAAEAGGSEQALSDYYESTRAAAQAVVDEMRIFSGSAPPDGAGVSADDLLLPGDVPLRDRLGPWRVSAPTGTVLACHPGTLDELGAAALSESAFDATIAGYPDQDPSSVVRTAVLGFADEAAAGTAYDTVTSWIRDCPDGTKVPGRTDATVEGGRGSWWVRMFSAPDVCTDCDATRFDRMGVAQLGDRLVLVSLAEVGGPMEPEGLDDTMTALFDAAVDRARP